MNTIKFRIAAKTDVGLVRTNNEDNFQAASDLASSQMRWVNNEICSLGEKGALLVVADGMGGMNAGEVASEIAIETVKEWFTPENITSTVMASRYSIERFMNEAIVEADAQIKKTGRERPEARGMGTTIVIGWLLNGKLYVSWCGDSRAYIYNPEAGLHQITKDHSYVQGLVDKGKISYDDAFDYPDSNIITRSLADGGGKAKPESLLKPYDLCDNDIILLCTDGLSGMIRDHEMEEVIRANEHNMDQCVDALIRAACDAEGADNITVCLCQILQGGGTCNPDIFKESDARLMGPRGGNTTSSSSSAIEQDDDAENEKPTNKYKNWLYFAIGVIILLLAVIAAGSYFLMQKDAQEQSPVEKRDSVKAGGGNAHGASAGLPMPGTEDAQGGGVDDPSGDRDAEETSSDPQNEEGAEGKDEDANVNGGNAGGLLDGIRNRISQGNSPIAVSDTDSLHLIEDRGSIAVTDSIGTDSITLAGKIKK